MVERLGQGAGDGKPAGLPESDRPHIGGDDEIELHGAKPIAARFLKRMRAHRPRDPVAHGIRRDDVAAIGDVRSAASVVGAQIVGADHAIILDGHEDTVTATAPLREHTHNAFSEPCMEFLRC